MGISKKLLAMMGVGAGLMLAQNGRAAEPVFNAPSDVAAIKALEQGIQVESDINKVIGYYAPDALVLDIYTPGIYKGREQIKAGFAPQLAVVKTLKADFPEINIASDGKFACAAMQIHFDTTLKDGKSLTMSLREIDAFKKIGGKWLIIQQHVSLPVDAKTGMGVTDGAIHARGPLEWSAKPLPGPATSPAQAKKDIRRWMEVGGASKNLEELMQYYGPGDDTLVYDNFYPGALRGLKEIRDNYAAMMGNIKDAKLKMPVFTVDSDGLFAVQADTQDLKLTTKDGGNQYVALRQSDCLRRAGDKWYTFFEMISFPIDAKTGKAVMAHPEAFK